MAFETGFERPYASVSMTLGSCSLRSDIIQCRISESNEAESSRLLERASPDHDGTVGRYPVTDATLTLVP